MVMAMVEDLGTESSLASSIASGTALTPEEQQELAEILRAGKKSSLFRAKVEIWLKWIGAVLGAVVVIQGILKELIKGIIELFKGGVSP